MWDKLFILTCAFFVIHILLLFSVVYMLLLWLVSLVQCFYIFLPNSSSLNNLVHYSCVNPCPCYKKVLWESSYVVNSIFPFHLLVWFHADLLSGLWDVWSLHCLVPWDCCSHNSRPSLFLYPVGFCGWPVNFANGESQDFASLRELSFS